MSIAIILSVGLLVTVVALNFLTGSIEFFFGQPSLQILKSRNGANGFSFGFKWNKVKEPAKFDLLKIALYNPFGNPTQIDVTREFDGSTENFARDLNLGSSMGELMDVISGSDGAKGTIMVEISSRRDGITHQYNMTSEKFLSKVKNAMLTAEEYTGKFGPRESKVLYQTTKRSFIADPMPEGGKTLKIASNPAFAGEFAGGGSAAEGEAVENFSISKVWIEEGCIVCDACETIYPEVFEVLDKTCIIRPNAPLNDGLRIEEAAEACPVEVIKFAK